MNQLCCMVLCVAIGYNEEGRVCGEKWLQRLDGSVGVVLSE